ncbi:hypothetical protein P9112_004703 [Eukaryota sp. TZLM1-RC]
MMNTLLEPCSSIDLFNRYGTPSTIHKFLSDVTVTIDDSKSLTNHIAFLYGTRSSIRLFSSSTTLSSTFDPFFSEQWSFDPNTLTLTSTDQIIYFSFIQSNHGIFFVAISKTHSVILLRFMEKSWRVVKFNDEHLKKVIESQFIYCNLSDYLVFFSENSVILNIFVSINSRDLQGILKFSVPVNVSKSDVAFPSEFNVSFSQPCQSSKFLQLISINYKLDGSKNFANISQENNNFLVVSDSQIFLCSFDYKKLYFHRIPSKFGRFVYNSASIFANNECIYLRYLHCFDKTTFIMLLALTFGPSKTVSAITIDRIIPIKNDCFNPIKVLVPHTLLVLGKRNESNDEQDAKLRIFLLGNSVEFGQLINYSKLFIYPVGNLFLYENSTEFHTFRLKNFHYFLKNSSIMTDEELTVENFVLMSSLNNLACELYYFDEASRLCIQILQLLPNTHDFHLSLNHFSILLLEKVLSYCSTFLPKQFLSSYLESIFPKVFCTKLLGNDVVSQPPARTVKKSNDFDLLAGKPFSLIPFIRDLEFCQKLFDYYHIFCEKENVSVSNETMKLLIFEENPAIFENQYLGNRVPSLFELLCKILFQFFSHLFVKFVLSVHDAFKQACDSEDSSLSWTLITTKSWTMRSPLERAIAVISPMISTSNNKDHCKIFAALLFHQDITLYGAAVECLLKNFDIEALEQLIPFDKLSDDEKRSIMVQVVESVVGSSDFSLINSIVGLCNSFHLDEDLPYLLAPLTDIPGLTLENVPNLKLKI